MSETEVTNITENNSDENYKDVSFSIAEEAEKQRIANLDPDKQAMYELMKSDKKFVAVQGIMQLKNTIKKMETVRDSASDNIKSMLPDDKVSIVEARVDDLDLEALDKLDMRKEEDWQKVKDVYTVDGQLIEFATKPDSDKIKVREMHRDYLTFIKKFREESAKFDQIEKEYRESMEKLDKELEEAIGEEEAKEIRKYSSFAEYYLDWIDNTLAREDISDNIRSNLQKIKDYDTMGIKLDFLKNEIIRLKDKTGNTQSLLWGFRNSFAEIAEKVNDILSTKFPKYGYHLSFAKFYDIEKTYFKDEIDEKYNNLFMFVLFRFIKNNYNMFNNFWMITIGEIVTQLGFLARPVEERPKSSAEFVENVKQVVKLAANI